MGLPEGWVTNPALKLTRRQQVKALGNGVVPQQAALALAILLRAATQPPTAPGDSSAPEQ
jgi:DNA (cytosine-5)-methyltransferase 1